MTYTSACVNSFAFHLIAFFIVVLKCLVFPSSLLFLHMGWPNVCQEVVHLVYLLSQTAHAEEVLDVLSCSCSPWTTHVSLLTEVAGRFTLFSESVTSRCRISLHEYLWHHCCSCADHRRNETLHTNLNRMFQLKNDCKILLPPLTCSISLYSEI